MNSTTNVGSGTDGHITAHISSTIISSTHSTTATVAITSTPTTPSTTTAYSTTIITTTNSTLTKTEATDDNDAKIACGVIFGVIGVALIVVGVILLLRWLERRRTNASHPDDHNDVTIRPSHPGEPAAYSKLGATTSIHPYGEFNDESPTRTDEPYGNQDTSHAQYNNVARSGHQAQAETAVMPHEVFSNENYEPMDIADHAPADDGNRDPMYVKMKPTTNEAYNNKSHTSSDTLQKPRNHSPGGWQDSGYVNTIGMNIRSPAAFPQVDSKSSDSETMPHNETNSSDYINTTTIDEIVANGVSKRENRPDKRNRKK